MEERYKKAMVEAKELAERMMAEVSAGEVSGNEISSEETKQYNERREFTSRFNT